MSTFDLPCARPISQPRSTRLYRPSRTFPMATCRSSSWWGRDVDSVVPIASDITSAAGLARSTGTAINRPALRRWTSTLFGSKRRTRDRSARQRYLRSLIQGKRISPSNLRLAHLLSSKRVATLVRHAELRRPLGARPGADGAGARCLHGRKLRSANRPGERRRTGPARPRQLSLRTTFATCRARLSSGPSRSRSPRSRWQQRWTASCSTMPPGARL